MEQHAVPQDITGFKFKLVGDMTLKQFGELAAGAIFAYLFYASPWHPLVKLPIVFLCGLTGIALAFFPIEERPLDLWILNFLRAIYKPTLYVWKKGPAGTVALDAGNLTTKPPVKPAPALPTAEEEANLGLAQWPFSEEEKKTPEEKKPETTATPSAEPEISEEPVELPTPAPTVAEPEPRIMTMEETPVPGHSPAPSPLSVEELTKLREQKLTELEEAKKKLQEVTKTAKEEAFKTQLAPGVVTVEELTKLREAKIAHNDAQVKDQVAVGETELNALISQNKNLVSQIEGVRNQIGALSGVDTTELTKKLDVLMAQKNDLSAKIASLSDTLAAQRAAPLTSPSYQQPRTSPTQVPGVRVLNKPQEKNQTISLSDQPNVISGMIINDKGAPLEGVIVVIKDHVGNSIRALKTNGLGQFVVATPLENGTYYVEMEKAGYVFSVLEVSLSGQVLAPLEIPAKTQV